MATIAIRVRSLDVTTDDIATLGGDVIGGDIENNFVLTRLHARYGKRDMKDDLRFKGSSRPVAGGRGALYSKSGIEYGTRHTRRPELLFPGALRDPLLVDGPARVQRTRTRGVWGGPPDDRDTSLIAASKIAFAPRGRIALAEVDRARPVGDRIQAWERPQS